MLYRACCVPGNVECGGREIVLGTCEDAVINNVGFGQVYRHFIAIHGDGAVGNLHDPEQPGLPNVAIEIVHLRSRTGIEEVNSYEHKRAHMMTAVGGYVLPLVQ